MSERKIITIKEIDVVPRDRALSALRELSAAAADLVSEVLRRCALALESTLKLLRSSAYEIARSSEMIVVSDVGSIVVSRGDLESVDKAVVFKYIRELTFADDVTAEIFSSKVHRIARVNTVVIPRSLSAVLVASRCELVDRIVRKE